MQAAGTDLLRRVLSVPVRQHDRRFIQPQRDAPGCHFYEHTVTCLEAQPLQPHSAEREMGNGHTRWQDVPGRVLSYGHGDERLDDVGLLRRRYWDPTTEWEIVITSDPDIGPKYRTIDEIRVSPVPTGKQALSTTESLKGLTLKGVAIGDPASKAEAATRRYSDQYREKDRLGPLDVDRVCGIFDGVSICFDTREKKVVAMALGAGD